MGTTAKALRLSQDLKDLLTFRLPSTWTATQSYDSSGNPVVTYAAAAWSTGVEYFIIRIKPRDQLAEQKNSLGLAQDTFAQHDIEILAEGNTTAGGAQPASNDLNYVLKTSTLAIMAVEVAKKGCRSRWYLTTHAVQPTTADLVAAKLKQDVEPDLYNGLTNSQ